MADSNHPANPPVQTADAPRVSPDGTSGVISFDGEGSPLWDGQIIDAPLPPV